MIRTARNALLLGSPLGVGYTPAREAGCLLALDWQYGLGVALNAPVTDWRGRVGGAKLTTGSAGNRPTHREAGIEADGGDYLDLDSTLSVNDCSIYVACDMAGVSGSYFFPLGSGTGANEIVGIYASTMYCGGTHHWTRAYTGSTGRALWRFCRVGTDMRMAATGQADAAMTPTGSPDSTTQNYTWLLARQAYATYSANTTRLLHLYVFAPALGIDTAADRRVLRYLYSRTGLAL